MESYGFNSLAAGVPPIDQVTQEAFMSRYHLIKLRSTGVLYGCMAGMEAWLDAGLDVVDVQSPVPDWDSGCIFGCITNGFEATEHGIRLIDRGEVKKIGGRSAQQAMNSGISAYLGGIIGMGNQVSTNSSNCNTGNESILEAYYRIRFGLAKRMLAGSSEGSNKYLWGGYDAITTSDAIFSGTAGKGAIITAKSSPSDFKAISRPMDKNASGLVVGSGAGALVLESLESAVDRGARIYAEILGGALNCGSLAGSASYIANSQESMIGCISQALEQCNLKADDIDLISGHLVSLPENDLAEIRAWKQGLRTVGRLSQYINAPKSMFGHCIGASGAIEMVACTIQLYGDFIHPTLNLDELNPQIGELVEAEKIPKKSIPNAGLSIVAKSCFGFGDINSCIMLRKWQGN